MTGFPLSLLILPEPARTEAWTAWRAELDIDGLSYDCQQLLPAAAGSLHRWLEGDPLAARIQGIVKMVWSRNQVRLHKAAELHQALIRAAVSPVAITGPLAWTLLAREEGSIRAIPNLTMLIPRAHVENAVAALAREGWELHGNSPDRAALDWSCFAALAKGDETFHLHWRMFPAPAEEALRSERAVLERLRPVAWNRYSFDALSPEADLLHRLSDRFPWDPVPWQADVLMTPFAQVDWRRFHRLSALEPLHAIDRLMELRRDWQLPVPEMAPRRPRVLPFAPLRRRIFGRARHLWRAFTQAS